MAAYVFTPTPVTGGATVRFDTASGSTTPATVYPLDYAQPIPGALLRAHTFSGNLPQIESDSAVLYQKTLDYRGTTVTATATLTGVAQATGAPVGTVADISAALSGTYGKRAALFASTALASGTLPAVMTSPPTITEKTTSTAFTHLQTYDFVTNTGLFSIRGAHLSKAADGTYYTPDSITPTATTTTFQPYAIEFMTDSPYFVIQGRGTADSYRLVVDGSPVTAYSTALANTGGAVNYLDVDFTAAGGRAMRHIRLESDHMRVLQLRCDKTDTVIAPQVKGPRCIIVGDSIVEGTGASTRVTALPWQFGRLMQWTDVWASGSGGTGYTVDGTPTYTGRKAVVDRLQNDVTQWAPDVVIFTAGRNDLSTAAATVQSAASAAFAATKAALPNALLLATSPLYLGTPSAAALTTNAAISAAATANGVPYIDLLSPVIFGGTGKVGTTTGDGPADFILSSDATHPTQAGHDAIARALAGRVTSLLRTL